MHLVLKYSSKCSDPPSAHDCELGEEDVSVTHHAVALDALQVPPLVGTGGQVHLANGQLEFANGVVLK